MPTQREIEEYRANRMRRRLTGEDNVTPAVMDARRAEVNARAGVRWAPGNCGRMQNPFDSHGGTGPDGGAPGVLVST